MKKSRNEKNINVTVYPGIYPIGWKHNTFEVEGNISAGEYVWFGVFSTWFTTRFDYGGECYKGWFDHGAYPEYDGEPTPYINVNDWATYCNIKWSWYFTYTAFTSQNYVRKIAQGVKLSDTRKLAAICKRNTKQSITASSGLKLFETFFRNCVTTVRAMLDIKRYPVFSRTVMERIKANTDNSVMRSLLRNCVENIASYSIIKRMHGFARVIQEVVKSGDGLFSPVVLARTIADKTVVYEVTRLSTEYIKTLEARAVIAGETVHSAEYYRLNTETIQAEGILFRGLIMLVRLFSSGVLRDYIFGRFLKAREELKLKSCISLEITLDSKII